MPLPVSAEAETAAPAVKQNNLWVSTGKTFVNRIYTVGLTTCGSALVRIAGATESEGFQKVASFVNKWICGGNNTGQTLAEIQALCNEILNEVKIVDQHLKEYDAEIENTLQKIQYTEAKNELNQQWSKDIDVYETAGNVGNTLSAYEDYMKAAQLYMDGKADINAVEKSKQKLYDNFIEVYKAAGNSFENPTDEKNYAGSTSVKAYVTGSSENEQENHPEDEEHLQDENKTNAKTGDESKATIWIAIWIFSMLVFGCGIKYKKVTSK